MVAYLSSVVSQDRLLPTHLLVRDDHPEFSETGLRQTSVIRLDKLITVSRSLVRRRLGRLGPSLQAALDTALKAALGLP